MDDIVESILEAKAAIINIIDLKNDRDSLGVVIRGAV